MAQRKPPWHNTAQGGFNWDDLYRASPPPLPSGSGKEAHGSSRNSPVAKKDDTGSKYPHLPKDDEMIKKKGRKKNKKSKAEAAENDDKQKKRLKKQGDVGKSIPAELQPAAGEDDDNQRPTLDIENKHQEHVRDSSLAENGATYDNSPLSPKEDEKAPKKGRKSGKKLKNEAAESDDVKKKRKKSPKQYLHGGKDGLISAAPQDGVSSDENYHTPPPDCERTPFGNVINISPMSEDDAAYDISPRSPKDEEMSKKKDKKKKINMKNEAGINIDKLGEKPKKQDSTKYGYDDKNEKKNTALQTAPHDAEGETQGDVGDSHVTEDDNTRDNSPLYETGESDITFIEKKWKGSYKKQGDSGRDESIHTANAERNIQENINTVSNSENENSNDSTHHSSKDEVTAKRKGRKKTKKVKDDSSESHGKDSEKKPKKSTTKPGEWARDESIHATLQSGDEDYYMPPHNAETEPQEGIDTSPTIEDDNNYDSSPRSPTNKEKSKKKGGKNNKHVEDEICESDTKDGKKIRKNSIKKPGEWDSRDKGPQSTLQGGSASYEDYHRPPQAAKRESQDGIHTSVMRKDDSSIRSPKDEEKTKKRGRKKDENLEEETGETDGKSGGRKRKKGARKPGEWGSDESIHGTLQSGPASSEDYHNMPPHNVKAESQEGFNAASSPDDGDKYESSPHFPMDDGKPGKKDRKRSKHVKDEAGVKDDKGGGKKQRKGARKPGEWGIHAMSQGVNANDEDYHIMQLHEAHSRAQEETDIPPATDDNDAHDNSLRFPKDDKEATREGREKSTNLKDETADKNVEKKQKTIPMNYEYAGIDERIHTSLQVDASDDNLNTPPHNAMDKTQESILTTENENIYDTSPGSPKDNEMTKSDKKKSKMVKDDAHEKGYDLSEREQKKISQKHGNDSRDERGGDDKDDFHQISSSDTEREGQRDRTDTPHTKMDDHTYDIFSHSPMDGEKAKKKRDKESKKLKREPAGEEDAAEEDRKKSSKKLEHDSIGIHQTPDDGGKENNGGEMFKSPSIQEIDKSVDDDSEKINEALWKSDHHLESDKSENDASSENLQTSSSEGSPAKNDKTLEKNFSGPSPNSLHGNQETVPSQANADEKPFRKRKEYWKFAARNHKYLGEVMGKKKSDLIQRSRRLAEYDEPSDDNIPPPVKIILTPDNNDEGCQALLDIVNLKNKANEIPDSSASVSNGEASTDSYNDDGEKEICTPSTVHEMSQDDLEMLPDSHKETREQQKNKEALNDQLDENDETEKSLKSDRRVEGDHDLIEQLANPRSSLEIKGSAQSQEKYDETLKQKRGHEIQGSDQKAVHFQKEGNREISKELKGKSAPPNGLLGQKKSRSVADEVTTERMPATGLTLKEDNHGAPQITGSATDEIDKLERSISESNGNLDEHPFLLDEEDMVIKAHKKILKSSTDDIKDPVNGATAEHNGGLEVRSHTHSKPLSKEVVRISHTDTQNPARDDNVDRSECVIICSHACAYCKDRECAHVLVEGLRLCKLQSSEVRERHSQTDNLQGMSTPFKTHPSVKEAGSLVTPEDIDTIRIQKDVGLQVDNGTFASRYVSSSLLSVYEDCFTQTDDQVTNTHPRSYLSGRLDLASPECTKNEKYQADTASQVTYEEIHVKGTRMKRLLPSAARQLCIQTDGLDVKRACSRCHTIGDVKDAGSQATSETDKSRKVEQGVLSHRNHEDNEKYKTMCKKQQVVDESSSDEAIFYDCIDCGECGYTAAKSKLDYTDKRCNAVEEDRFPTDLDVLCSGHRFHDQGPQCEQMNKRTGCVSSVIEKYDCQSCSPYSRPCNNTIIESCNQGSGCHHSPGAAQSQHMTIPESRAPLVNCSSQNPESRKETNTPSVSLASKAKSSTNSRSSGWCIKSILLSIVPGLVCNSYESASSAKNNSSKLHSNIQHPSVHHASCPLAAQHDTASSGSNLPKSGVEQHRACKSPDYRSCQRTRTPLLEGPHSISTPCMSLEQPTSTIWHYSTPTVPNQQGVSRATDFPHSAPQQCAFMQVSEGPESHQYHWAVPEFEQDYASSQPVFYDTLEPGCTAGPDARQLFSAPRAFSVGLGPNHLASQQCPNAQIPNTYSYTSEQPASSSVMYAQEQVSQCLPPANEHDFSAAPQPVQGWTIYGNVQSLSQEQRNLLPQNYASYQCPILQSIANEQTYISSDQLVGASMQVFHDLPILDEWDHVAAQKPAQGRQKRGQMHPFPHEQAGQRNLLHQDLQRPTSRPVPNGQTLYNVKQLDESSLENVQDQVFHNRESADQQDFATLPQSAQGRRAREYMRYSSQKITCQKSSLPSDPSHLQRPPSQGAGNAQAFLKPKQPVMTPLKEKLGHVSHTFAPAGEQDVKSVLHSNQGGAFSFQERTFRRNLLPRDRSPLERPSTQPVGEMQVFSISTKYSSPARPSKLPSPFNKQFVAKTKISRACASGPCQSLNKR